MRSTIAVLHICYSDNRGGAAIAAYRQHLAMLRKGVASKMLVVDKYTDEPNVILLPMSVRVRIRLVNKIFKLFFRLLCADEHRFRSVNIIPTGVGGVIDRLNPECIRIHWPHGEMLSLAEVSRRAQKIQWFSHDMWPILGLEHYDFFCEDDGFENIVISKLDSAFMRYKRKALENVFFIAPSEWLASIFHKKGINCKLERNVLDGTIFKPDGEIYKVKGKRNDDVVFLCGAIDYSDPRKGGDILIAALQSMHRDILHSIVLLVFGDGTNLFSHIDGLRVISLGMVSSEYELAKIYRASDYFLLTSRQDNYPNTGLEAVSCGVKLVGFNNGGVAELVKLNSRSILVDKICATTLESAIVDIVRAK